MLHNYFGMHLEVQFSKFCTFLQQITLENFYFKNYLSFLIKKKNENTFFYLTKPVM